MKEVEGEVGQQGYRGAWLLYISYAAMARKCVKSEVVSIIYVNEAFRLPVPFLHPCNRSLLLGSI